MQFIGLGFRKSDTINLDLIRDKAAEYDLLASKVISEGDFREGLEDFAVYYELEYLQLNAFSLNSLMDTKDLLYTWILIQRMC